MSQFETDAEKIARLESANGILWELINTPEVEDFDKALPLEAAYQVTRWGTEGDAGKTPSDWYWLIGYLAGKAVSAAVSGDRSKAQHHCISTAAVLRNWHAHLRSDSTVMRPGIAEPDSSIAPTTRPNAIICGCPCGCNAECDAQARCPVCYNGHKGLR